jgi:phage-related protein
VPTFAELVNFIGFRVDPKGVNDATAANKRIKASMEETDASLEGMVDRFRKFGEGLAQIQRIGRGILDGVILNFAETADATAKLSTALGISIESLQKLQFAGQLSGVETNDLNNALTKLGKKAQDAADGNKQLQEIFKGLGVSIKGANGQIKAADALFGDLANAFKQMPQGARKTQVAMTLFEETGARFINLLNAGQSGIKAMGSDMERLGGVISADGAKKAEAFNDQMLRAKTALQGVRNSIATALLPSLTSGLKRFAEWISEGGRAQRILTAIKLAAKAAAVALVTFASIKVLGILQSMVALLRSVWAGLKLVNAQMLIARARMLLWLGPIALVAAAVMDLMKIFTGGESVIAKSMSPEQLAGLKEAFGEIAKAGQEVIAALAPALASLVPALLPLVPIVVKIVKMFAKTLAIAIKAIAKLLKFLMPIIKFIAKIVTTVLGAAFKLIAWQIKTLVAIWTAVGRAIGKVGSAVASVWTPIMVALNKAVGAFKDAWIAIKPVVMAILTPLKAVFAFITKIINWIGKAINKTKELLGLDKGPIGLGGGAVGFDPDDPASVKAARKRHALERQIIAQPLGGGQAGPVTATTTINQTITPPAGVSPAEVAEIANERARAAIGETVRTAVQGARRPQ